MKRGELERESAGEKDIGEKVKSRERRRRS